jgi:recombination protein RecT
MADVQRNPKLLECTPTSIFNAYLTMAGCGFMPSAVSGEAYVLPYLNSKKNPATGQYEKVLEAQFQMGYQGLVTLFYKAGVTKITGGIVHTKDKASMVNGVFTHEVPLTMSKEERGEPIGAYVTVLFRGQDNTKYMNAKDIMAHAKKFSKSFDPAGKHSPWNPDNDPERTMWLKTVLKAQSKLLPKNETINRAIDADNADSIMSDRLAAAKELTQPLKLGNLQTHGKKENHQNQEDETEPAYSDEAEENQDQEEPPN